MELKPLNSLTFFCRNGLHEATACRCPEPIADERFWKSWTIQEKRWALIVVAVLIGFIYIGVTVR